MSKVKKRARKKKQPGLPPGALVYTGESDSPLTQAESCVFNPDFFEKTPGILQPNTSDNKITWIDLRGLGDLDLLQQVGEQYSVHPLALEDTLNTQQRAKLEEYDDCIFFVLHALRYENGQEGLGEVCNEQIAFYAGVGFVISFQENPDDTFNPVIRRLAESAGRIRRRGSDYLLYALIDAALDEYFNVADAMERAVSELEDLLHSKGADPATKWRLYQTKKALNRVRGYLLPLREAVNQLYLCDQPWIDPHTRPFLRDLKDHATRIWEAIDHTRENLSNIEALFHAESANRLNEVMRMLTVISTIFIPLSFVAGIYGMNFENMPELNTRYGYFVTLGFMLVAMLGMLFYFRKKKWV
ncbi:MAG: magnesium/cobalt transporter CorA [Saprospiraceae bacterium]